MKPRVTRSGDCGNSPKQKLLEDLTVALALADQQLLEALTVPDLVWTQVGRRPVEGQSKVLQVLARQAPADEVSVERVVSHGRAGAVNGEMTRDGKRTGFCHMFEFLNTKCTHVKAVKSYTQTIR